MPNTERQSWSTIMVEPRNSTLKSLSMWWYWNNLSLIYWKEQQTEFSDSRASGGGDKPEPLFWCFRELVNFQDQCNVMEVGALVWICDAPHATPDRSGTYHIPVCIWEGTYHTLVDLVCNQTSIHQSLVQGQALGSVHWVKVICVHKDVHKYLLVPVIIKFQREKHS